MTLRSAARPRTRSAVQSAYALAISQGKSVVLTIAGATAFPPAAFFRREALAAEILGTVLARAANSMGPGGPMGPLFTPLRTPGTLSRLSITH